MNSHTLSFKTFARNRTRQWFSRNNMDYTLSFVNELCCNYSCLLRSFLKVTHVIISTILTSDDWFQETWAGVCNFVLGSKHTISDLNKHAILKQTASQLTKINKQRRPACTQGYRLGVPTFLFMGETSNQLIIGSCQLL